MFVATLLQLPLLLLLLHGALVGAAAAAAHTTHLQSRASDVCALLHQKFPDSLLLPSTAAYTAANTYWALNSAQTPHCIFTPRTAQEASNGLAILTKSTTAAATPFAIRAGGHAFIPLWSSTSKGVTVNLQHLSNISLSSDETTVTIGAGARWGQVYEHLERRGLSVAGGRASTVGVGGLVLGGGLSFFVTSMGFACDSAVAFQVVTATGAVVWASAHEHADLYRALKGSGAPFVLVTAVRMRTVKLPDARGRIWGGLLTGFGPDVDGNAIIRAVVRYGQGKTKTKGNASGGAGVKDLKAHVISAVGLTGGPNGSVVDIGLTIPFYQTPTSSVPAPFEEIYAASQPGLVSNTAGIKPLSNLTREIAGEGLPDTRHEMWPLDIVDASTTLLEKMWSIMRVEFSPLLTGTDDDGTGAGGAVEGLAVTLNMVPLGRSTVANGIRLGGQNVLGMDPTADLMSLHIFLQWTSAADDVRVHAATVRTGERCVDAARRAARWSRTVYMNYANPKQDPIASYGEENVRFLRDVARRWDPSGVWGRRGLVEGGFKIPG